MSGVTNPTFGAGTVQSLRRLDSNNNGVSRQELARIDTNQDGNISAAEGQAGGIDGGDVEAVNAAYRQHASNPNGIVFNNARLDRNTSANRMLNVFQRVDSNQNGFLSESELNTALHSNRYTGADATAVAALSHYRSSIEEFADDEIGDENDGVTRADIRQLPSRSDAELGMITDVAGNWGDSRIAGVNRSLTPNGVNSIRPNNIQQGLIGDCTFLAGVGSMASTAEGRQRLQSMIQQNQNGTYTVTFPKQSPVTVSAPTDAELAVYGNAGQDGTWLSVLEKAYAQSTNNQAWVSSTNDYDEIASGRQMSTVNGFLTGHSTDTDDLNLTTYATLRNKLGTALGANRVVTAGIRRNMPFTTASRDNGLPMGHAYTVLSYNRTTDQITLRNPWGHAEPANANGQPLDGNNDGTFTMSLTDFNTYFSQINYEQAQ